MADIQKLDRRIERTRSALRKALLELIRRDDWNDINVGIICAKADIARSSFYLHYDNKADLLDDMFANGMQTAWSYVEANSANNPGYSTISWLVDHILANGGSLKTGLLLNDVIIMRFQKSIAKMLEAELILKQRTVPDGAVSFVVGGVFAAFQNHNSDQRDISQTELCDRLNSFADRILA